MRHAGGGAVILTDQQCRAVSLMLGQAHASPEARRRFALLDRLTREGRCAEIMAAGSGPDAWERLASVASGLRPLAPVAARRRATGRPRASRGKGWPALAWAIVGSLQGGERRLSDVSRDVGRLTGQVYQMLVYLAAHQVVERSGKHWRLVRHGRPW